MGLTHNGLHRPLRLHLAADGRIDADAAVLATGNQPPAPPCPVPASPRYISNPWVPGALDGVADGSPVIVLGTGLCVRIEYGARVAEVAAGWLINATGPAADVTATTDPLLRGLLGSGLARPDPLRLGIEADAGGALLNASGTPSDSIFTLGPPLRGQLYETTAIPEIRDQAAALAGRLLAVCRARAALPATSGMTGSAA